MFKTDTKFRVTKSEKGYCVEEAIHKKNFWGDAYIIWEGCITFYGSPDVYYFDSFESARDVLLKEIEMNVYTESTNLDDEF